MDNDFENRKKEVDEIVEVIKEEKSKDRSLVLGFTAIVLPLFFTILLWYGAYQSELLYRIGLLGGFFSIYVSVIATINGTKSERYDKWSKFLFFGICITFIIFLCSFMSTGFMSEIG